MIVFVTNVGFGFYDLRKQNLIIHRIRKIKFLKKLVQYSLIWEEHLVVKKKCVFGCESGRFRIAGETRAQVLQDFKFYIPDESRVYANHNKVHWDEIPNETSKEFNSKQVNDMINLFRGLVNKERTTVVNFDFFENLSEAAVNHYTEIALAIYLCKLKTGYTDEHLAHVFVNGSRHILTDLNKARYALEKDFTPHHLGI
ncbi:hypothetical protein KQX54_008092 [Cotesia glomerata]|uniref:Uncharacterized protein n=1 Tax=Cotesia glomerata TaxID=32391 RepID=A0AAV7HSC9_COTGL|nr:hypothetical protein KQX54_008092 [Cotesia glomerata]